MSTPRPGGMLLPTAYEKMTAAYRRQLPERNAHGVRLSPEEQASVLIAGWVNDALIGTEIRLLPGPLIMVDHQHQESTRFSYSPAIRDLEGYAFNDLAIVLSRSVDVFVCAASDCNVVFRPKGAGQEYHDPTCASRERVRRHRTARARLALANHIEQFAHAALGIRVDLVSCEADARDPAPQQPAISRGVAPALLRSGTAAPTKLSSANRVRSIASGRRCL